MIQTVEISKVKLERLERQARAYRKFVAQFFTMMVRDPIDRVVHDFRDTDLYTDEFLNDLNSGLRKSSYARTHGHPTSSRRSSRVHRQA